MDTSHRLGRTLGRLVQQLLHPRSARPTRPARGPRTTRPAPPAATSGYPGDFQGMPHAEYAPHPDHLPDPGEIVWTWVPYEEDHSRGKDRPVLVVGRDGDWLLALGMTSLDHDRDAGQEAAEGRYWVDIGRGDWDPRGRPSEVRVNRVVRVDPRSVRRVSGRLDRDRFDAVVDAMRYRLG